MAMATPDQQTHHKKKKRKSEKPNPAPAPAAASPQQSPPTPALPTSPVKQESNGSVRMTETVVAALQQGEY